MFQSMWIFGIFSRSGKFLSLPKIKSWSYPMEFFLTWGSSILLEKPAESGITFPGINPNQVTKPWPLLSREGRRENSAAFGKSSWQEIYSRRKKKGGEFMTRANRNVSPSWQMSLRATSFPSSPRTCILMDDKNQNPKIKHYFTYLWRYLLNMFYIWNIYLCVTWGILFQHENPSQL